MTTINERNISRPISIGASSTTDRIYSIEGSDDEDVVLALLDATAPASIVVDGATWYIKRRRVEFTGPEAWEGIVEYGPPSGSNPPVGQSKYSFDTGGGTQHITNSLETKQREKTGGGTPPDFKWSINVNGDSVDGVDITVPVFYFSETHVIAEATVDQAYKLALFNLTGCVNDGDFRGFSAGEVLFLGAAGTQREDGAWDITFKFAASLNQTNIDIGNGSMTIASKLGWEYLWVYYVESYDATAKRKVMLPEAAYVEQVYYSGDFSGLGI